MNLPTKCEGGRENFKNIELRVEYIQREKSISVGLRVLQAARLAPQ